MTHPYLSSGLNAVEERTCLIYKTEIRTAIFARRRRLNFSAHCVCHQLGPVAYAKHRHRTVDSSNIYPKCVFVIYRQRTAREDYTNDTLLFFASERILVVGDNLAVDAQLTHTTTDKLCRLRAEVEDYNFFLHI